MRLLRFVLLLGVIGSLSACNRQDEQLPSTGEQQANMDETFPVEGKIHLFDEATTEEGLKKWINNQHSDGLFPEVPTPIFTGELPKESCSVTSHKQTGTSENPGPSPTTFKDYEVELSVKEHAIDGKVKLSAFTDTALVHVKSK